MNAFDTCVRNFVLLGSEKKFIQESEYSLVRTENASSIVRISSIIGGRGVQYNAVLLRKLRKREIRDASTISGAPSRSSCDGAGRRFMSESRRYTLQCIVVLTRLQLIVCYNASRDNRTNRMNHKYRNRGSRGIRDRASR